MTSKIKVDNINKVSDDSNIIKKCGTTTTIGSGASNPIVVDGSAITLGRCGGTVALASGASQSGFGRSGSVNWQTTPKTGTFIPVNGEGYFVNTSGGVSTANLPAGSAGAIVSFSDYTRTFATNNLTISPNGSEKIGGIADDVVLNVNGQALTLVYVDATEGWINVQNAEDTKTGQLPAFIAASGGTSSTCGDFKIHTFTGPGTFTVSCAGNSKGSNTVSYLVVAGGGGGGFRYGGGGGAGGFREGLGLNDSYTGSPLRAPTGVPVSVQGYPIVIGGGGAGGVQASATNASNGVNSTFSTIASAGGGRGANCSGPITGGSGGSGGGGKSCAPGGAGNTPPVSPPQGNNGGQGSGVPKYGSGGGGGAGVAGTNGTPTTGGNGGNGLATSITGSSVARGGGGGGGTYYGGSPAGAGGTGGGGNSNAAPGSAGTTGDAGTVNTGGGAGGGSDGTGVPYGTGGAGGSGIVVIRYKFQ